MSSGRSSRRPPTALRLLPRCRERALRARSSPARCSSPGGDREPGSAGAEIAHTEPSPTVTVQTGSETRRLRRSTRPVPGSTRWMRNILRHATQTERSRPRGRTGGTARARRHTRETRFRRPAARSGCGTCRDAYLADTRARVGRSARKVSQRPTRGRRSPNLEYFPRPTGAEDEATTRRNDAR